MGYHFHHRISDMNTSSQNTSCALIAPLTNTKLQNLMLCKFRVAKPLGPSLRCVQPKLQMLSNGRCMVALRIRRVSTSLSANLMLGFHKLLLYKGAISRIGFDCVGVQEFHERCNNLLVDFVELMRFFGMHIINTRLCRCACPCRYRFRSGRIRGGIICRGSRRR
jgi:hypothetical protein